MNGLKDKVEKVARISSKALPNKFKPLFEEGGLCIC